MKEKDCTIKVEVKYSPDAERDGFVSVWSYQMLDRHNAYWAFQYLVEHMGRTGVPEKGVAMSKELAGYLMEIDALKKQLKNYDAQLGEANLQIAILQSKIINQETSVNEVSHLIAELAKVRAEEERLRITLNRIVSMGTEELDG